MILSKLLAIHLQCVGACFNAGATHGQEMMVETMATLLEGMGHPARQRTTFCGEVGVHRKRGPQEKGSTGKGVLGGRRKGVKKRKKRGQTRMALT